jgi:hypothetical protein
MGLAAVTLDPQAVLADCCQMGATCYKGYIRPDLGKRGAIGPANAAGANYRDAQSHPPHSGHVEARGDFSWRSTYQHFNIVARLPTGIPTA